MGIIEQIELQVIQALKQKKEAEVLALRGAKSAIKNAEIAKRPEKLSELDIVKVLRSEIKKRQDAKVLFEQGKRQDLVDKEQAEIEIIEKYLPKELADSDLKKIVAEAVKKVGAKGPQDFGKVMGMAMKQVAGKADGNRVSEMVKEILADKNS